MDQQIKSLMSSISNLFVIQIVTLVTMVAGAGYLYNDLKVEISKIGGPATTVTQAAPEDIENWEEFERAHNAVLGANDAEVVIIEYTDFQCPFCKRHNDGTRKELLEKYGDSIRFVHKHFPLEAIHPQAMMSAIASQCARKEGKFWALQELLFTDQANLQTEALIQIGQSIGLSENYINCIENEETREEVEQDIRDGIESGVSGTPMFLVNGKVIMGALPLQSFEGIIEEVL